MQRWYRAVSPLLKSYYGTGGDMNVDEIHEVIPNNGRKRVFGIHKKAFLPGTLVRARPIKSIGIGQLRQGVIKVVENPEYSPDVSRKYTVADLITGFGVSEAVRHYYEIYGGTLQGKRAIVQGFGNVASAAAYYLAQSGAR